MSTTSRNRHGNHDASCLCCELLDLSYEADLSDVTPGSGFACECLAGHFDTWDFQEQGQHLLFEKAEFCADFAPKKQPHT